MWFVEIALNFDVQKFKFWLFDSIIVSRNDNETSFIMYSLYYEQTQTNSIQIHLYKTLFEAQKEKKIQDRKNVIEKRLKTFDQYEKKCHTMKNIWKSFKHLKNCQKTLRQFHQRSKNHST